MRAGQSRSEQEHQNTFLIDNNNNIEVQSSPGTELVPSPPPPPDLTNTTEQAEQSGNVPAAISDSVTGF